MLLSVLNHLHHHMLHNMSVIQAVLWLGTLEQGTYFFRVPMSEVKCQLCYKGEVLAHSQSRDSLV